MASNRFTGKGFRFHAANGLTTTIDVSGALGASYKITLPQSQGSNGTAMINDGNGNLSFETVLTSNNPVINGDISGTAFLDEDDFASDSATKVASQQSIKAYIAAQIAASVGTPAGTVIASFATSTPSGYLYCDGSAVSRTTYATLFSAIGTSCGNGDASTTFNLPDLRGRFLRGHSDGSTRDPDRASRTAMATGGNTGNNVGSVQTDALQGHEHTQLGVSAATTASGAVTRVAASNQATQAMVSNGTNGTPRTSNETRPINAYVRYYIKT